MVRVHDGVPAVLAQDLGSEITFKTDRFSLYAIAYYDEPIIKAGEKEQKSDTKSTTQVTAYVASPKTGEERNISALLVLLGVTCCTILEEVYSKRKYKK